MKNINDFSGEYISPKTICTVIEVEGLCAASNPEKTDKIHPTSASVDSEPWKDGGSFDVTF